MFYSEKFKLLVIGIPKTGTVSVQKALLEGLDKEGTCHGIHIGDTKFYSHQFKQGIINHARAREFKEVLDPLYESLTTIAFIRNPYAKLVSAYFFTGSLPIFKLHKGRKKRLLRMFKYSVSVLAAKALPFKFWIYIYPYRSSMSYIAAEDGEIIVNYIGRTENLQEDLNQFLKESGVISRETFLKVSRSNKSKHNHWANFYNSKTVLNKANKMMKQDIKFYESRFGKINMSKAQGIL